MIRQRFAIVWSMTKTAAVLAVAFALGITMIVLGISPSRGGR